MIHIIQPVQLLGKIGNIMWNCKSCGLSNIINNEQCQACFSGDCKQQSNDSINNKTEIESTLNSNAKSGNYFASGLLATYGYLRLCGIELKLNIPMEIATIFLLC